MKVNLDLSLIQSDDTIIVANNRQVLAIKQSLSEQHGSLKMPNIFSYTSWLQNYWQQNNPKDRSVYSHKWNSDFSLKSLFSRTQTTNLKL